MASQASSLAVSANAASNACVLTARGVLNGATYRRLRDIIIEAALDEPSAVLVDVDELAVPASSAWSVFTSARCHVSTWPDIPIALVCTSAGRRAEIAHRGVTRYVPVFTTADDAATAVIGRVSARTRVRRELPASLASLRGARDFVAELLTAWRRDDLIPVATVATNVFVENVLQHTASAPVLLLETDHRTITVSVQDGSYTPAARHEDPYRGGERVSGLAIVASLCRAWGSTPTPSGKIVWAVVGPENSL